MRFPFNKDKFNTGAAIDMIKQHALPLHSKADLSPLIERLGQYPIVMLGEASHGTHEYYTWRSYITRRLVEEHGFSFIAVEGDWPDCYKINRFVKGDAGYGKTALEILRTFNRWPTWMWANWEIAALTEWLRKHNEGSRDKKVGFYGLDVYSLWESLEAIMKYLEKEDPEALKKATAAIRCFEPYREDEGYSYASASRIVPELCEHAVIDLLKEIQRKIPQYNSDEEQIFSTEQNAQIAVNAERYYRAMIQGGPASWNVRDTHMADTLDRLLEFHGPGSKVVIWEHNTHIGDSSATDMADEGMYNIGELVRQRHGRDQVFLVGFGSYQGSVIAGKDWGAEMEVMDVPKAREHSWEALLHTAGAHDKLLFMDRFNDSLFWENRIDHRAIGVVYRPAAERYGNYVPSILPMRYDAFIYIDSTAALHPLHLTSRHGQIPDTYPFGM